MKKMMLTIALVAIIMIGAMPVVNSQVTFYVKITLVDNCYPSGYHGYYCVQLDLSYDSQYICTAQNCTIIPGTHCYPFTCDFDPDAEEAHYAVTLGSAVRYPSGTCSSSTGNGSSSIPWLKLIDSGCPAGGATLSVTL
jgi:hypothetical protein